LRDSLDNQAAQIHMAIGAFPQPERVEDMEDAVSAWYTLADAYRSLAVLRDHWENIIGQVMREKRETIAGVTIERHMRAARTEWDKEALHSAVQDSRLPPDPYTGEIPTETPLEKHLHVFNTPAPRLGALRERGIDPDQFCHVERLNLWQLREYSA
jgi:hypothetical protein